MKLAANNGPRGNQARHVRTSRRLRARRRGRHRLTICPAAATDAGPLARAARPEDAGLSRDRLGHVTAWLQAEVDAGRIPGAVVLIGRGGSVAFAEAFGFRDREAERADGGRFDLPHRLDDQADDLGRGDDAGRGGQAAALARPVADYLPEFKDLTVGRRARARPSATMTVQDLLRHTSGLTYAAVRRLAGADASGATPS